jgi:hypothetical protein
MGYGAICTGRGLFCMPIIRWKSDISCR